MLTLSTKTASADDNAATSERNSLQRRKDMGVDVGYVTDRLVYEPNVRGQFKRPSLRKGASGLGNISNIKYLCDYLLITRERRQYWDTFRSSATLQGSLIWGLTFNYKVIPSSMAVDSPRRALCVTQSSPPPLLPTSNRN